MKIKIAPLRVKAAGEADGMAEGQFEAYASVFGNVDSYGDIVEPGAFTRTLSEWSAKGDTIPVLWGHDMNDPFANIGGVLSAEQDDHGLKISGQLDMDNPTAQQVYRLMKGRRTNSMSFAYSVRDSETGDDGNHLKDLDLYEVSVVQVPANDLAEVLAVKSLAEQVKAGRVLAQKHIDSLRKAHEAIGSVIEAAEANEEEKASGNPEAKSGASDEEPPGAKSSVPDEEPKSDPSVDAVLAVISTQEKEI